MRTCSREGCDNRATRLGLCRSHYQGVCSVDGCDANATRRGMCQKHYTRMKNHGDVSVNYGSKGGIRKHPLYMAWSGMKGRCHNPNHLDFPGYGGRGITVCDRWRADFRNFLSDMGERPANMSLDRIDPAGPYSPENCRWATASEQRANLTAEGRERQRAAASQGARRKWEAYRANA